MKKRSVLLAAVVIAFSIGVTVEAGKCASTDKATTKKPSVTKEAVVTATATVQAIDLKNRLVTLKDEEGKTFEIVVGKRAKNLSQVKVGDIVEASYYESVAINVYKPGEAPSEMEQANVLAKAKPGEMPGGMAASQATVTATVQSIDKKKQSVVLEDPDGKTFKVNVKNPKNLVNVNVGDEVVITYTRAYAISVEKPTKK
jgi:ribosomal 50S subunit-recycling heat shock protein